jgi:hypothetical protein
LPEIPPALTHLRLDPGSAPGLFRIARMVLKGADGKVVKAWIGRPAPQPPAGSAVDAKPKAAACHFPNWHRPSKDQTGPNFAEWGFTPRATPRVPDHQQPKHPA